MVLHTDYHKYKSLRLPAKEPFLPLTYDDKGSRATSLKVWSTDGLLVQ